jgi:hypothetical protein
MNQAVQKKREMFGGVLCFEGDVAKIAEFRDLLAERLRIPYKLSAYINHAKTAMKDVSLMVYSKYKATCSGSV